MERQTGCGGRIACWHIAVRGTSLQSTGCVSGALCAHNLLPLPATSQIDEWELQQSLGSNGRWRCSVRVCQTNNHPSAEHCRRCAVRRDETATAEEQRLLAEKQRAARGWAEQEAEREAELWKARQRAAEQLGLRLAHCTLPGSKTEQRSPRGPPRCAEPGRRWQPKTHAHAQGKQGTTPRSTPRAGASPVASRGAGRGRQGRGRAGGKPRRQAERGRAGDAKSGGDGDGAVESMERQLERLESSMDDAAADDTRIFVCDFGCGFEGTFSAVAQHELSCPHQPQGADASQGDSAAEPTSASPADDAASSAQTEELAQLAATFYGDSLGAHMDSWSGEDSSSTSSEILEEVDEAPDEGPGDSEAEEVGDEEPARAAQTRSSGGVGRGAEAAGMALVLCDEPLAGYVSSDTSLAFGDY